MKRRSVLASTPLLFTGGCIGGSTGDPGGNETATPEPTVDIDNINASEPYEPTTTSEREPEHWVIGLWMNNVPDEADPYPTDEEPLKSNEVLKEFFDATASQDKYPGSEDRKNNGEGEVYTMQVTTEQKREIVRDSRAVDYNEEGWYRGRFVDHDGTYIWYTVETK